MAKHDHPDNVTDIITASELNELQNYLDSDTLPECTMTLDVLDGFLTALIIGPTTVPTESWMPFVWDMFNGREIPSLEYLEQSRQITRLVLKLKANLTLFFSTYPELYQPLFMELDPESEEMYNEVVTLWANGFMVGIYSNENNWTPLLEKEKLFAELIMPIFLLSSFSDNASPLPPDAFNEIREILPEFVKEIRKFWLPKRQQEMARTKGVVIADEADRIGRNDPCLCGSGKKFKKCCGK